MFMTSPIPTECAPAIEISPPKAMLPVASVSMIFASEPIAILFSPNAEELLPMAMPSIPPAYESEPIASAFSALVAATEFRPIARLPTPPDEALDPKARDDVPTAFDVLPIPIASDPETSLSTPNEMPPAASAVVEAPQPIAILADPYPRDSDPIAIACSPSSSVVASSPIAILKLPVASEGPIAMAPSPALPPRSA